MVYWLVISDCEYYLYRLGIIIIIIMVNWHAILSFLDAGIDCFKCVSLEWQNRACDDPFHNNFSSGLLESPCMGGRKGRNGLFPATACIKLTGYYSEYFYTYAVKYNSTSIFFLHMMSKIWHDIIFTPPLKIEKSENHASYCIIYI